MELTVNKVVKEVREKLQAEAQSRETLLKKTFEGEQNVLKTKIQALEKETKEQSEQIVRLLQQLEAAYQKVQDVAVKAVGGVSDSRSLADLQQFIVREIKQQTAKQKE